MTLRDILEDEGHHTFLAESGERALDVANKEELQMVILDVKLPGMDGIATFETLRTRFPSLEVLMISGHSDIETAVKAVKMGAYDFLEKPLSMTKVLTAVRNIAERQRLLLRVHQEKVRQTEKYKLVGKSRAMEAVRDLIQRAAPTNAKVLIRGESGTGKELVAYAIHHQSARSHEPYVTFNSAAIPTELVESELFGYEKGAFTGAGGQKIGKLELAHKGTLFLDEIGDMSLTTQAKILRFMQEGTFERVGGTKTHHLDVRLIAATHKNLETMVQEGTFRKDLFYRLNVIPITLPPLREREGDLPLLVDHFLDFYARELNMPRKSLTPRALELLETYPFPGNVRELKNLVERLYILLPYDKVQPEDLRPYLQTNETSETGSSLSIQNFKKARREFEKAYLTHQLERFQGNISKTARHLGMQQSNLSRKLKELGIENRPK